MSKKALVVEDDSNIAELLRLYLGKDGFEVALAPDGGKAVGMFESFQPDIVLLDIMLPIMDGWQVCGEIRKTSKVPIIMLTAKGETTDKVTGLEMGADDYITKPFSIGELLARMRVSIRRAAHTGDEPVIQCGDLSVDLSQRRVTIDNQEIKLTPTEYDIIKVLAQNAGKVLTHRQLLKAVWGDTYADDTHYVRVYIGQLRRKIEPNPTQPRYIITESGIGYRLMAR